MGSDAVKKAIYLAVYLTQCSVSHRDRKHETTAASIATNMARDFITSTADFVVVVASVVVGGEVVVGIITIPLRRLTLFGIIPCALCTANSVDELTSAMLMDHTIHT